MAMTNLSDKKIFTHVLCQCRAEILALSRLIPRVDYALNMYC